MIRPDDQVLDYMIYQKRIDDVLMGIESFFTGYAFWLSQVRRKV